MKKRGKDEEGIFHAERVEWHDSASASGWTLRSDIDMVPLPIVSVGFVLGETKEAIAISCSIDPAWRSMNPLTIPKSVITSRKRLFKVDLRD
jgi:hypothetical protein